MNLLQHRPAGEKWAVLVNEFGEVGVDGTILKTLGDGVVVREVPGGCLCCVSGLPFQFGMNSLISREKPDVLLIEPTGLGHPRQILKILSQSGYQDVLKVANTVTLVDP
ncbi:GTP-binding protein, partial [Wenyingzhuangia sp. 1_MG-2023]|nr:GTP-binding protein [Wenyingzhuangia sp. 1_MG-2023]